MSDETTVEVRITDLRELLDIYLHEWGGDVCFFADFVGAPEDYTDELHALIFRVYELVKPSLPEFCEDQP